MRLFTKDELFDSIEKRICKWCPAYNRGEFSEPCRICKVSVVYQTIDLMNEADDNQAEG